MNKKDKSRNIYNLDKQWNTAKKNNSIFWGSVYKKRFRLKKNQKYKLKFAKYKIRYKPLLLYMLTPKKRQYYLTKLKFFRNFCVLNLISKDKNFFFNYSKMNGDVLKNFSCGIYYKGSLKRSYYAINSLLFKSNLNNDYIVKNKKFFINIWSRYKDFKIKRNIRDYINEKNSYNIISVNYIRLRAHNGVRSRKQRRK